MFTIFSQQENLIAVFNKYSVKEALQVKFNIAQAIKALNIPSDELVQQMRNEGLCITDFSLKQNESKISNESSPSIIRNHLFKVFLDKQKLIDLMSGFSMAESIEIRGLLNQNISELKLPSDNLIAQMEQEGLSLQRIGIENTSPQTTVSSIKLARTKEVLAQAMNTNLVDKKLRIKSQLNALLEGESESKKSKIKNASNDCATAKQQDSSVKTAENVVKKLSLQEALERSLQTDLTPSVNC
ncbi:hypothetical protein [Pseudoalteromonas denitrificans]|uniref:Uncharacterized protein n=1 Tax=Pseudoalteromonas denitrificans DSM 6059 TaxID=1123010 RepID=A0A1I1L8G6_9GAMM|nr:hypothetical protein [Pseudoalteromonas denitrificans]SFC69404.1 hypothetical protein SAMN02745724_02305 [Pseudoalteromonas denitrificans DSM 6059]